MSQPVKRTVEDGEVSVAVVTAVADVRGVTPAEFDADLYGALDPDALDRLFADPGQAGRSELRAEFDYAGCRVTVHVVDERVVVEAVPTAVV